MTAPLALVLESSWATAASIGTFLVIVATAIATVMHMREVQAANKVAALKAFFDAYEGPELADAFRFVRNDLARRLRRSHTSASPQAELPRSLEAP